MAIGIRTAERVELDQILDWAAREGWNPGLDDTGAFFAADPEGFLVAEDEGRLAAAISVVRFGAAFCFLGFYMAHPDFRGQGIGLRLWTAALAAREGRTIGLDGVVAQQENYRRSGFAYAHANLRYGGRPQVSDPTASDLVSVSPVLVPMVTAYDAGFNPQPREAFLAQWLRPLDSRQSVALLRNGAVTGYGTIRQCRTGYKIGPLFADTESGADLLFRKLAATAPGEEIFLDIPEPNAAARALCGRYNLKPVFETARMYRGPAPDLPLNRLYGITTFELG